MDNFFKKIYLLALLIIQGSAYGGNVPPDLLKEVMAKGEDKYKLYCSSCHQVNGDGMPLDAPPLHRGMKYSSYITTDKPADTNIMIILNGIPGTTMTGFKHLSNEDLAQIVTYIRNAWGNNTGDIITADDISKFRNKHIIDSDKEHTLKQLMAMGASNYRSYCARCHQLDGVGQAPHGPSLITSYMTHDNDLINEKIKTVLYGAAGTRMRGYAQQLTDTQIAAILTYISNAWGRSTGQIIQPEMIKQQRLAHLKKKAEADKQSTIKALMALGEKKYRAYCARCHLPDGSGGAQPGVPSLKGSPMVVKDPPQKHVDLVLIGVPGSIMRAFGPRLSNLELSAIITYERNAWGNNTGQAIQPAFVGRERKRLQDIIDFQAQHQVMQQYIKENAKF